MDQDTKEAEHIQYLTERWESICADIERNRAKEWDPAKLLEAERLAAQEIRIAKDEIDARKNGEAELQRARRLLRYATEAGSMGAATALEKRVSALEKSKREAEEAARRSLSANKIDALVEAIRRLPKPAQAQILAMLSAGDGVGAH